MADESDQIPQSEVRSRALAWLVLLIAPLALLGPSLFGDRTYVPYDVAQWAPIATALTDEQLAEVRHEQNTDVTETPLVFLPEMRFAKQELGAGRLPEWNPYARGGAPLLCTSVVGLMYPPNWVVFAGDDPEDAMGWVAYLSFATAALLMYGFLRSLGVGVIAAVFGGIAFMFSGTLYANAHFYQRLAALIWLPGMLWAIQSLSVRRSPAAVAGLAISTAMCWLAGFPSYSAPATLVAGIFGLDRIVRAARADGLGSATRLGGWMALGGGLGMGLAAVQLLPMFAFFPESNRTPPAAVELARQGFDPAGLLGYFLPDVFGHPHLTTELPYDRTPLAARLFTRGDWDTGKYFWPLSYNFVEYTVFPGTLAAILAIAALFGRGRGRLGLAIAFAALLILATGSSLLAAAHQLPGMESVWPKRFLGPGCALVAALAAIGFDSVRRSRIAWAVACAVAIGGAATFLGWLALTPDDATEWWVGMRSHILEDFRPYLPGLTDTMLDNEIGRHAGKAHEQLLANLRYGGLALALAAAWLLVLPWLHARPRARYAWAIVGITATLGQLVALAEGVSGGRVLEHEIDSPVHEFLREKNALHATDGGISVARADARRPTMPFLLPPCTLVPDRIRDVNIYTFVDGRSHVPFSHFTPGQGQLFLKFWVNALVDGPDLDRPYLDLLGVRYLLSQTPLQHAGEPVGPPWKGPRGEFFVYERPDAMARAFVVPALQPHADLNAVSRALAAPDFEPRRTVLVDETDPERPAQLAGTEPEAADRSVTFTRDVPIDVTVEVGDGPPGYLVLSDSFMSGWSATVNGQATPIARGNLFMRVVPLPAGPATVHFHYDTPRLGLGAAVTVLSALALLVLPFVVRRRRRFAVEATDPDVAALR